MGFKSSRENRDEDDSQSSRSFGNDESAETDTTRDGLHSSETTGSDDSVTERSIQRMDEGLAGEGSSVTDATIENDLQRSLPDGASVTDATIERTVEDITEYGLSVTDAVPGWQDKVEELKKPPGVPADIDHFNNRSVQRSLIASHEHEPAGETQVPDSVREVISSSGQVLDSDIQESMEDRMGNSLGDVRIHTGVRAASACESINARAFTVGNHVAFNHGEYDPSSPEGQHVLTHELAHVRQQTGGALSMLPQEDVALEIDPDPQLEREAEETAQRVLAGGELGIQRLADTAIHIQRRKYERYRRELKERGPASETIDEAPADLADHPAEDDETPTFGDIAAEKDPTSDGVHRDVFFKAYPEMDHRDNKDVDKVIGNVHHAIEQQIIKPGSRPFFPGLISPKEMHSIENLRGIPDEIQSEVHQSVLRVKWNEIYREEKFRNLERKWMQFYKNHVDSNLSELTEKEAAAKIDTSDMPDEMLNLREEIRSYLLEKVKELDKKLGRHFLPEMYTNGGKTDE